MLFAGWEVRIVKNLKMLPDAASPSRYFQYHLGVTEQKCIPLHESQTRIHYIQT